MADAEVDGQTEIPLLREIAERLGNNASDRDAESVAGLLARQLTATGAADGAVVAAWNGTAHATDGYGSVLVSVNNLSGGDVLTLYGSVTGANPKALAVADLGLTTGALAATITADGLYLVPAAGQLTYAKTGSASTPTVNIKLKR